MTREDAIKRLKLWLICSEDYTEDDVSMNEAIRIAINSLEQEPKTDVLDKIRAEIDLYLFQNEFGAEYRKEVSQIIDKYKAESEASE